MKGATPSQINSLGSIQDYTSLCGVEPPLPFLPYGLTLLITVRIRRMTEGNVFTWYTIPGGTPILPDGGQGVPPSFLMAGGTPSFLSRGTPIFQIGGTPSFFMRGTPGGTPTSRSGPRSGWGTPWSGLDGYPRTPIRTGWGYPLSGLDGGYPPVGTGWGYPPPPKKTEQQSEYLLCGGRYASCVHAGGLSYYTFAYILHNTCDIWFKNLQRYSTFGLISIFSV